MMGTATMATTTSTSSETMAMDKVLPPREGLEAAGRLYPDGLQTTLFVGGVVLVVSCSGTRRARRSRQAWRSFLGPRLGYAPGWRGCWRRSHPRPRRAG